MCRGFFGLIGLRIDGSMFNYSLGKSHTHVVAPKQKAEALLQNFCFYDSGSFY